MPAHAFKTIRGVSVPTLGIGTFQVLSEEARRTVADALAAGYRHIDTASAYDNEGAVGLGLADSGVERDSVWVTTKVWFDEYEPSALRASAERSLRLLRLERLDLLLLHWPPLDRSLLAPALEQLNRLREGGLIREFGVSNFPAWLLEEAMQLAPAIFADQVEYHPKLSQHRLVEMAVDHDLLLEAYAPFGGSAGDVLHEPLLKEIALAHGATPAQVALAWLAHQDHVVVLPRSTDPDRRRENLAALQLDLEPEERQQIDRLADARQRSFDPPFAPEWRDERTQ